jgi:hypothetical protein
MDLKERVCKACKKNKFKVMSGSKQYYCSALCQPNVQLSEEFEEIESGETYDLRRTAKSRSSRSRRRAFR